VPDQDDEIGDNPMSSAFVFDTFDDSLVVMPISEARRLAALNDALETSSTWGEFLSSVGYDPDTAHYVERQFGDELPGVDATFDPEEIPGFTDGHWPSWPKQAMLDWLPASVQALGTIGETRLTGSFLHLDDDRRDDVIAALHAEGLECEADTQDLVARACGAWRYG
jgi:hypothetical protein